MPKAVAQNRKTTLAEATIAGRRAGRVTVRSTCHGVAPSVAAACAGRGSRDSHDAPTARITTATLKNTRPATTAAAVWSRPRKPERPAVPEQLPERHADDHGRQHERAPAAAPAPRAGPGRSSRCRTYAAGRPSTTESAVPAEADHSVNHSTRCTRGRPSTSATPAGSKVPSGQNPCDTMPTTGSTKNTPSTATGTSASAARVSRRPFIECVTGW